MLFSQARSFFFPYKISKTPAKIKIDDLFRLDGYDIKVNAAYRLVKTLLLQALGMTVKGLYVCSLFRVVPALEQGGRSPHLYSGGAEVILSGIIGAMDGERNPGVAQYIGDFAAALGKKLDRQPIVEIFQGCAAGAVITAGSKA